MIGADRKFSYMHVWLTVIVGIDIPGTRMWRRGANLEGDTANFVETEQVVEINGFKFSLLQVYSC